MDVDDIYMSEMADMDAFWAKMLPAERERLLRLLVREVVVWPDKVEIQLTIGGDDGKIVVPEHLGRNLGRTHIVLETPKTGGTCSSASENDASLAVVQALRSARKWQVLLATGVYRDKKSLADALGLSQSYLGRALRLATLSPVIVEKIMLGDLPDISVTKLISLATPIWSEQHRLLGIGE